jgi:parallel beta helix pectate lyase-like protein
MVRPVGRPFSVYLHRLGAVLLASALGGIVVAGAPGSVARHTQSELPVLHVALGGSDRGACTKAAPCASFDRAYRVAKPGQVVEIAGGSYPGQMLTYDPAKTSSEKVLLRPAQGASVTVEYFQSGTNFADGAGHFELRDVNTGYDIVVKRSEDVTLRNIDTACMTVTSVKRFSMYRGDVGPCTDGVFNLNQCGGCVPADGVLFDGVRFHDFLISNPEPHSECLQISGTGAEVNNLTIRNSTFQNCTDFDILVDSTSTGILIENNFFDSPFPGDRDTTACTPNCPRDGNSIRVENRTPVSNVTIQYNTALGGISVDDDPPGSPANVVVRGNIAAKNQCQRGQTFAHNVWSSIACSSSDRQTVIASMFVDGDPTDGSMNLRLLRGSRALGAGDPKVHPATDIDGRLRPVHLAPDAGAAQRETAALVLGQSIGQIAFRMSRDDVIAFYGNPRRSLNKKIGPAKVPVRVDLYRTHDGTLRVTYKEDVVVGIATDSLFYTTIAGLGRGTTLQTWTAAKSGTWNSCRKAYRRRVGARAVYFVTGTQKKIVREVSMIGLAYDEPCLEKKKS